MTKEQRQALTTEPNKSPHNRANTSSHNRTNTSPHNRANTSPHNRAKTSSHNRTKTSSHNRANTSSHNRTKTSSALIVAFFVRFPYFLKNTIRLLLWFCVFYTPVIETKGVLMKAVFYFMLFLTLVFSTSSYASPCSVAFSMTENQQTYIQSLKPKELQTINPTDLSLIENIQYFLPKQLKYFSTEQLQSLTGKQIRSLTLEQVKAFTLKQLKAFTRFQIDTFTSEQLNAINIKQIPRNSMNDKNIKLLIKRKKELKKSFRMDAKSKPSSNKKTFFFRNNKPQLDTDKNNEHKAISIFHFRAVKMAKTESITSYDNKTNTGIKKRTNAGFYIKTIRRS